MIKPLFAWVFLLLTTTVFSQDASTVLSLEEYLGYVKRYHPLLKQAQLKNNEAEVKLMKARGAFDPKLEVDYNEKQFKEKNYYSKLNSVFKIPTWYGIELKATLDNNNGVFLNPEASTSEANLYGAGVAVELNGVFMSKRMAVLKKAKLFTKQAVAEQQLLINEVLYKATEAYFNWLKAYKNLVIYKDYLSNAKVRQQSVLKSFIEGDKPAIDTLEAGINVKNRIVTLEKAKVYLIKTKLNAANFLWLENNIPVEINELVIPELLIANTIDKVLGIDNELVVNDTLINSLPKLQALNVKEKILLVEKRLGINNLLPKIKLEYNFLTPKYQEFDSYNFANYKGGVQLSFPLFLRKERANLKLTNLKLNQVKLKQLETSLILKNKIKALQQELNSLAKQNNVLKSLVEDYKRLVAGENKKFNLGEGSLFLVNYREVKLLETQLKAVETENKQLKKKASFFSLLNR